MSKLVIMGTIEVAPGKRDQVTSALMSHRARCLKDEPGPLQFEAVLPRDDHSKILIYEVYQDDSALQLGAAVAWVARRLVNGAHDLVEKLDSGWPGSAGPAKGILARPDGVQDLIPRAVA